MNIRKIISLLGLLMIALVFVQCEESAKTDKTSVANTNATAEVKKVSNAVSPNNGNNVNITGSNIKGNIANAANLTVFIDQSGLDNSNRVVGKGAIDGSGNFNVGISEGLSMGIYRFRVGAQKNYLVFAGNEKEVTVKADLNQINGFDVSVSGSDASAEFYSIMQGFVSNRPSQEEARNKLINAKSPLVSMWGAQLLFPANGGIPAAQEKLIIQKQALQKLQSTAPQETITKSLSQQVSVLDAQLQAQLASQKVKVGEPAPDITLKSPDGKIFSLSQLKGKVVLLDFWASWCGPCRRENPNVVKTYKQYNKKGFEVFSVSLDGINPKLRPRLKTQEQIDQQMTAAKNKWVQAIDKDQLMWPYHVSDLQHWGSPAAKSYGVSSIPKTFLIGRDGKIAAINPRGAALEPALKKLL
ncbi:MAG: TlpA disulfide reductase family protein [Bacteroidota bacterium]